MSKKCPNLSPSRSENMNFFISADLFLYAIYVYRRLFDYLPMTIFVSSDAAECTLLL